MRKVGLAMTAALLVAGCGGGSDGSGNDGAPPVANVEAPVPPGAPAAPPAPPPPTAKASTTRVETPDFNFTYAYPADAAAIPALATWLDADRDQARAAVTKDAGEARRESAADGFPFRTYESSVEWKRVASTPRFLSLSADTYDYTGGAHGSPGFRSLVWDKQDGRRMEVADVFTSAAAVQSAIGAAFCDALDVQRGKRRGAPVVRGDDSFSDCPKVADTTLILGSSDGRAIDRIGLLVGPYVAGPYAEGSYDLTLPVTAALLRAVRPEYRTAFATRG